MVDVVKVAVPKSYFNKDFTLLWQGNFISAIGTVVYGISLGFWILAKTDSTTLMGLVSASVVLPKLFFGPIAGSIVDRSDKKTVLVATDLIAGLTILIVAVLALFDMLQVSLAIVAGLIVGITEAFAFPAAKAALPLIVHESHLSKANAAYSSAFSASKLIGRSSGGFLFQLFGAPLAFLVNGISYIYCAVSEMFIKSMPPVLKQEKRKPILAEAVAGAKLLKSVRGLLPVFIIIAFLNFFGYMVVTFYMPFFQRKPEFGPATFGLVMAFSMLGGLIGELFFSIKAIPEKTRAALFCIAGGLSNLFIVIFPFFNNQLILMALIFMSGLTGAAINIVLSTALQFSIPSDYHGRVFAFVGMIGGLLVPLAMIMAGVLAEFANLSLLIAGCAGILTVLFVMSYFSGAVRDFLTAKGH